MKRRLDLPRRCPECFQPTLEGLACRSCGVELDAPGVPQGLRFDMTSPVHLIQDGGLGSELMPNADKNGSLHFEYGFLNVKHLAQRRSDPLASRALSILEQSLKEVCPGDGVTDEAARILIKDLADFRARYPKLASSQKLAEQLVENVTARLALRYPGLRRLVTQ